MSASSVQRPIRNIIVSPSFLHNYTRNLWHYLRSSMGGSMRRPSSHKQQLLSVVYLPVTCEPQQASVATSKPLWFIQKSGGVMRAHLTSKRPAVADDWTVEQLDGSRIDVRLCTCPELFEVWPWRGSVDCPIDWHRTSYTQATWEAEDDAGNTLRVDVQGYE